MLNFFRRYQPNYKNDTLSGLTVALALVPEAVAFAFVAGVSPIIGLYSAFFLCLITAVLGGRPGMISGATGAMAVVVVSLVADHGLAFLFPTVILAGLIQLAIGFARLGMFIRMVPHSVMLGFVNGLALVILLAQFGSFKTITNAGQLAFLRGPSLWIMLALVGLTMLIIWLLPKFTRAIPASLAAILTITGISLAINVSAPATLAGDNQNHVVMTVGDMLLTNARAKAVATATHRPVVASDGAAGVRIVPEASLPAPAGSGYDETIDPNRPVAGTAAGAITTLPIAVPPPTDGNRAAPGDVKADAAAKTDAAAATPGTANPTTGNPTAAAATSANSATSTSTAATAAANPGAGQTLAARAMASVDPSAVGIGGGLPRLFFLDSALPPITFASLAVIFPYALTLAGVGLIESLMTLTLIDEITQTRGRGNRECLGQGTANIISGLFGGMGGCAMIGQSLINVNSGGRGRLSGITAAVCLLLFVLFLAPWIEMIPMAALAGVMFMVVIGTFEWASLRMMKKVPASDYLVMLLVAGYTVLRHDLATAVVLGVIVSALVFAWRHATHMVCDVKLNDAGGKVYQLHGPLFFASVTSFKDMFDPVHDPADVVIDFYYSRVYDQSGLEAISQVADRYEKAGKRLHLTHLSAECRALLARAGDLVEVNVSEDPHYHIATDRQVAIDRQVAQDNQTAAHRPAVVG